MLHFGFLDSNVHRSGYIDRLNQVLEGGYAKNDPEMYDKLRERMADAIKSAKRLIKSYDAHEPPSAWAPCTRVVDLVERLLEAQPE